MWILGVKISNKQKGSKKELTGMTTISRTLSKHHISPSWSSAYSLQTDQTVMRELTLTNKVTVVPW